MFSSVYAQLAISIEGLEARVRELEQEGRRLDGKLASLKQPLQFFPFCSKVDPAFWKQLGERKLNEYKLSSHAVPISNAYYSFNTAKNADRAWLEVRSDDDACGFANEFKAEGGTLINVNTLEDFKALNKTKLIEEEFARFESALETNQFFANPTYWLTRFLVISFADLKRHVFVYWFAFPALALSHLSAQNSLLELALPGFFESLEGMPSPFFFVDEQNKPRALSEWHKEDSLTFGFVDPSPNRTAPSWFLRNFIFALAHHAGFNLAGRKVKMICLREPVLPVKRKSIESVLWEITLPDISSSTGKVIGWEPNAQQQMKPKVADLSQFLDGSKVSEAAVNLNLKLMKWRAFPELNETKLQDLNALILGCGTLGCAVIRGLMGWGVKKLTLVDSGKVSLSNPVRQSLFVAADVGKDKAEAARDRVLEIHPAMQVEFWSESIPMPGHSAKSEEISKLIHLVESHDVVFMLTDTRESRWFPTLLCNRFDKLCLNAALDFDSFLAMRHGVPGNKLGCYFCSDVMAPRNSTRNRTLDQQCTVTRPGLAPIAGALLVEMLVALVHHPMGSLAPATTDGGKERSKLGCGAVPHVIRGYLGSFVHEQSVAESFPQCTACSASVRNAFEQDGVGFVQRVLADPDALDAVTGLDKLKQEFDDTEFWEE